MCGDLFFHILNFSLFIVSQSISGGGEGKQALTTQNDNLQILLKTEDRDFINKYYLANVGLITKYLPHLNIIIGR